MERKKVDNNFFRKENKREREILKAEKESHLVFSIEKKTEIE
jgi:hypothetical protein